MREAKNSWVTTTRPNVHPHVTPTWAVWYDNRLYFDGSSETRRMCNIAANPHAALHLEDVEQTVIDEGVARPVERLSREVVEEPAAFYAAKYATIGYAPEPDTWDNVGLSMVETTLALAWTEFGVDVTRWRICRTE